MKTGYQPKPPPASGRGKRRTLRSTKKLQHFLQALGWSALALGVLLAGAGIVHGNSGLVRWAGIYVVASAGLLGLKALLAALHRARKQKYRRKQAQQQVGVSTRA